MVPGYYQDGCQQKIVSCCCAKKEGIIIVLIIVIIRKRKLETIVPQCFKNFDDSTESLGSRDGESSKTQEPYKATQVQESWDTLTLKFHYSADGAARQRQRHYQLTKSSLMHQLISVLETIMIWAAKPRVHWIHLLLLRALRKADIKLDFLETTKWIFLWQFLYKHDHYHHIMSLKSNWQQLFYLLSQCCNLCKISIHKCDHENK